jgi:type I restriction enzyme S subunit
MAVSIHHGVVPREALTEDLPRAEDLSNYKVCESGDIVLNRMRAFQGAIGISPRRGLVSPDYMVLRPSQGVEARYLHHLFRSTWFVGEMTSRLRGIGNTENGAVRTPRINPEDLGDITVDFPSLSEQRRIADFLDTETARLDSLMAIRLGQVAVLSELELARIGRQLSGLDPYANRMETGWPWLPSIPDRWTIGPVYAYFDVQLGKMLNPERATGENQHPYLRNANIHWYETDIEDMATMSFEPHEKSRYGLQVGDLLVCEGGNVGESAIWDGRIAECYFQKSLHRVRCSTYVPVEWLMYWLRFANSVGVFNADGNVSTIAHLTGEQLAEHRIPIPDDGPTRITELGSEISDIRKTQREMASANALLAERRQALITAAVTGQMDVTTARGGVG